MKKHYLQLTQQVWLVLFWAGLLMNQTVRAQSVPDSQFARLGRTLAITTDGGIVTAQSITENGSAQLQKAGSSVVKYSAQGDQIWQTGFLQGGIDLGGQIPGYGSEVLSVRVIAATTNGGVAVVGNTQLRGGSIATIISPTGSARRWSNNDLFEAGTYDDLIGTPDGGFLFLSARASPGGKTTAFLRKYNADVSVAWTKEIAYPTPNPATPDRSLTKGEAVINTPDGGYLIVGLYAADYDNRTENLDDLLRNSAAYNATGWVAKLDGQGNVSWQKLLDNLPIALSPNDISYPISVDRMRYASDVTLATDGNGYALVGQGISPNPLRGPFTTGGAILELNADGSFKRARLIIGESGGESFITNYRGRGGTKYYALGNSLAGASPQITLINPAPLPLNDRDLFKLEARRTFQGPDNGRLVAIGVAGDGGLVFASTGNQVVKLVPETIVPPEPPIEPLTLTQPTYNCQTGAITFNTSGGDGSTITYSAPGISRASATSNMGTVEPGLRGDPKPITITATQNGQSVSFVFDLGAFCNGTTVPQPPVSGTIPDQSYTVGQSVNFPLGSYFYDPTTGVPGYASNWDVSVSGLPEGLSLFRFQPKGPSDSSPSVIISGTPTTAGVYTLNVTASTSAFRNNPARATFKITVLPDGQPPVGPLTLTQPTYNCQTGAIVFNTSGGDGSLITFSAPGISRSSPTSNMGTVEPGLRGDPKPIPITATQNGQSASFVFDFGAFCNGTQPPQPPVIDPPQPPVGPLTLLAPSYDCASGAIVFRTSGGNSSPIEYMAPGITGWTTNPNQFVDRDSRTANDVKPFTLMARQGGVVVSYAWDLKAACGRARVGASEPGTQLSVTVLGNPVRDALTVEVRGAEGHPLSLHLVDGRGRFVESRVVERAEAAERQRFGLAQEGPALLLLRVISGSQSKTVKILKQ